LLLLRALLPDCRSLLLGRTAAAGVAAALSLGPPVTAIQCACVRVRMSSVLQLECVAALSLGATATATQYVCVRA